MKFFLTLICIPLLLTIALSNPPAVNFMTDASVMIQSGEHIGSGVAFKNAKTTFVWTDAHVVKNSQTIKKLINLATGEMGLSIGYADVEAIKVKTQEGRKIGEDRRFARIIRYSRREDIALLRVYEDSWLSSSTVFSQRKFVPQAGSDIWHIGSPTGPRGINSIFSGTLSFVGRLRNEYADDDFSGRIYDQADVSAIGGCSGGGIYLKSNGQCIGLMTEFLHDKNKSPGMMCFTPTRRLWEFSERNKCLWAMDTTVEVPNRIETITDDNIEVVEAVPPPMELPKE